MGHMRNINAYISSRICQRDTGREVPSVPCVRLKRQRVEGEVVINSD